MKMVRPLRFFLVAGSAVSLGLVIFPNPKTALPVVLAFLAMVWSGWKRREELPYLLLLLAPLSGMANGLFNVKGTPVFLPLFYGGLAGALFADASFPRIRRSLLRLMGIYVVAILFSAAVGVCGYFPWTGFPSATLATPWGGVRLINALGWVVLEALTLLIGPLFLLICGPTLKSRGPFPVLFALSAGLVLPFLVGALQLARVTRFNLNMMFIQGGTPQYNATFTDPNALGVFSAVVFLMSLSLWMARPRWFVSWGIAVMICFLLLMAGSRSAMLIVFTGMAVFFAMMAARNRNVLKLLLVFFALSLVVLASFKLAVVRENFRFYFVLAHLRDVVRGERPAATLLGGRSVLWKSGWVTFKNNPVAGVGAGAYLVRMPRYNSEIGPVLNDNAGNQYLQIAAEQGVAGLLLFLILIGWVGTQFIASPGKTVFETCCFAALGGLMVGFLFGAHLKSFEVNVLFWYLMALVVPSRHFLEDRRS